MYIYTYTFIDIHTYLYDKHWSYKIYSNRYSYISALMITHYQDLHLHIHNHLTYMHLSDIYTLM
jgi:hypothetical protein